MSGAEVLMAAAAVAAVSGGLEAFGDYQAGKAQKNATKYNAKLQRAQAEEIEKAASDEDAQLKRRIRRLMAKQRAATATSGFTLTGLPGDTIIETAYEAGIDAARIRNRATSQAASLRAGAGLQTYEGEAALYAGKLGAGSTLLTRGTQATMIYGDR